MTQEIAKAINAVSKKVNDVNQRLDEFFGVLHKKNAEAIEDTEMALTEFYEANDEETSDIQMALTDIYEMLLGIMEE